MKTTHGFSITSPEAPQRIHFKQYVIISKNLFQMVLNTVIELLQEILVNVKSENSFQAVLNINCKQHIALSDNL